MSRPKIIIPSANDTSFLGETSKAYHRRKKENWFENFAPEELPGIDIGCGIDPLNNTFDIFDQMYGSGDATYMDGIPDQFYQTVYASHVLEHLNDPVFAVKNWFRILKPGGYLIVVVPHRDLYEKKKELPSNFNQDHKHFWLPTTVEDPCTLSLAHVILAATKINNFLLRTLNFGWKSISDNEPSYGEYSIEAIVQKPNFAL